MKTYHSEKLVAVIFRCKRCKLVRREDITIETQATDNEHPESYLRCVKRLKREAGGRWQEAHYFQLCRPCNCPPRYPTDKPQMIGKAIEGRLKADHPCDARCTGAVGHSCECSCGGANHGIDHK